MHTYIFVTGTDLFCEIYEELILKWEAIKGGVQQTMKH